MNHPAQPPGGTHHQTRQAGSAPVLTGRGPGTASTPGPLATPAWHGGATAHRLDQADAVPGDLTSFGAAAQCQGDLAPLEAEDSVKEYVSRIQSATGCQ